MKHPTLVAVSLALLAFGPAACGGEADVAQETSPEAPAGIAVSDAKLSLPAVGGNPGAVYFSIANDSESDVMIRSAYVSGAESATIHQTATWNRQTDMQEIFQQPVLAGETVVFEPATLHVMVNNLDDSLAVGGTAEVTLTFVGGDKVSFDADIRAAGDEG